MNLQRHQDKLLLTVIGGLFLWFFLSSLSIAYHRAPQQDDAMFATVIKNFLQGEGWATNYGEKILFNPDLTAGPALLLPAVPMMIAFGNQPWIPAMTGAIVNIVLSLLILWQLYNRDRRPVVLLAFLLSLSLFAVNDFKTFTGYYSSSLLFVLALLLVSNQRYKTIHRLTIFGMLAAIGLYTKPLILLSFASALPFVIIWFKKHYAIPAWKIGIFILLGFMAVISPWHLYKQVTLEKQGESYTGAYQQYNQFFFEHHGSGIGQFKDAKNKLLHIEKTIRKNTGILQRFLKSHLGIPLVLVVIFSAAACFYFSLRFFVAALFLETAVAFAIVINLLWFICFSFALSPGHAFFAAFLFMFLLFYVVAAYSPSRSVAIFLCVVISASFLPAHKALRQAYSFRNDDALIHNQALKNIVNFVNANKYAEPIAGCGYSGAPWRIIYLRRGSDRVIDCYHLLEDGLQQQENGHYQWKKVPDFVLAVEGLGLLGATKSQAYVLEPLLELCSKNVLYQQPPFFGLCRISGAALTDKLDPDRAAQELARYQQWYRTRLKISV